MITMSNDLISKTAAIALADNLKNDLPDDERITDAVMAHNEGILEYQTALSMLPSAQTEEDCDSCKYGYFGNQQYDNCRVRYPSHYERRTDG